MNQSLTGSADLVERITPRSRIVAVVVTYNRKAQLRRTVQGLLAEDLDELIVVDNASTDGSTDFLYNIDDPRLCKITLDQNCGGAGGFEVGLQQAVARFDPDWCVVMDDDARPDAGSIARFRGWLHAGHTGEWDALAAAVYYPDGKICEMNRPSRNPFWNLASFARTLLGGGRSGFHVQDEDYAGQQEVPIDVSSFVGLFLSRSAIQLAGFPDGNLFIYGDDVLYTLKLSGKGGNIGFAPWLRFQHDCTTFRRGGGHIHRPMWKVYYNYRNGLLAYRAAAGPILFWPVLLLVIPKWLMKARQYETDWALYVQLLWLAIYDGVRGDVSRPHRFVRKTAAQARNPTPMRAVDD
ncbi:MAG: glycosyltransferase [bacterium]